jgi:hypothetical protein
VNGVHCSFGDQGRSKYYLRSASLRRSYENGAHAAMPKITALRAKGAQLSGSFQTICRDLGLTT